MKNRAIYSGKRFLFATVFVEISNVLVLGFNNL